MSDHYDRYNGMEELLSTDGISRQVAISAICNACGKIDCDKMDKCEKLQLPPANNSGTPNSSDTISRQAAIDIIKGIDSHFVKYVEQLPSAQPEIIRCKDCKHWIPYDWMFSEVWRSRDINDYPEDEIGCNYCDMTMKANDFCSRGERKTE